MSDGEKRLLGNGERARAVLYCVIPHELAPKLHDLLRRHFGESPRVEVVVEQRGRERRRATDRRTAGADPPAEERRKIRSATGRRVGERRAPLVEAEGVELPRRARRYAEQIRFLERLEPPHQRAEDHDTARLVMRFQAGDRDAFTPLYQRYFDRVYAYVRVTLKDQHEAEDVTQQVFATVFEKLPEYERRSQPFRGWLFVVARNHAISQLRKLGRIDPVDPNELARRNDANGGEEAGLDVLGWLSDRDLMLFFERLPLAQRQVLVLRYMLDLSDAQAAEVLGRKASDVRALQSRAIRFLEQRLSAIGRTPKGDRRKAWRVRRRQAPVLRSRRFAISRTLPNQPR